MRRLKRGRVDNVGNVDNVLNVTNVINVINVINENPMATHTPPPITRDDLVAGRELDHSDVLKMMDDMIAHHEAR